MNTCDRELGNSEVATRGAQLLLLPTLNDTSAAAAAATTTTPYRVHLPRYHKICDPQRSLCIWPPPSQFWSLREPGINIGEDFPAHFL